MVEFPPDGVVALSFWAPKAPYPTPGLGNPAMDDADIQPPRARTPRPLPGTEPIFRDVVKAHGTPSNIPPSDNPVGTGKSDQANPQPLTEPGDVDLVEDTHPDILACLVSSPRNLPERDQALQQLWRMSALPIAEQIRTKYRHAVPVDFVGETYSMLWQRLVDGKFDLRKGTFEAWWRTVVINAAKSAWCAAHDDVALTQDHEPLAVHDPAASETILDQLTDQLSELRTALDGLAPREELRAHVNYYAVLLLEIRRAVAARLRLKKLIPNLGMLIPSWAGQPDSQVIETLLPWHAAEEQLAFRGDLSKLGEIWISLRRLLDFPPHDLGADSVCQRIVSSSGNPITRDVWYNWKRHVKNKLVELNFPRKWDYLF